jgi:ATP-dependent protease ClpP protease subunit
VSALTARTGRPSNEIVAELERGAVLDAARAKERGLVDAVVGEKS